MADLIDEACASCHRQAVEVKFRYQHPWRLGILWGLFVLLLAGLAKFLLPLIPLSQEWRYTVIPLAAAVIGNFFRLLEPRVAKRTAYLRCRLCGEASSRLAISGLGTVAKT